MENVEIVLKGYRCLRCGHEWAPRNKGERPRVCANCKSAYWDRPRRTEAAAQPTKQSGKRRAKGR